MQKLPKVLVGLVDYFKEIEKDGYRLDQASGENFAAVRSFRDGRGNRVRLSDKDFAAAEKLSRMCGKCVGLHLADFFEAPAGISIEFMDRDEVELEGKQVTMRDVKNRLGTKRNQWPIREFTQGMAKLAAVMHNLAAKSHFMQYRQKHYADYGPRMKRTECLTNYLRDECGAPDRCFSHSQWPAGSRRPSEVLTDLIKHNFAV